MSSSPLSVSLHDVAAEDRHAEAAAMYDHLRALVALRPEAADDLTAAWDVFVKQVDRAVHG